MAGYFGTEMQQRLQAQAEASVEFHQCDTWRVPGRAFYGQRRPRQTWMGADQRLS